MTINTQSTRREFLKKPAASVAPRSQPDWRVAAAEAVGQQTGGPLGLSINAYSFSKLLNDRIKDRGAGATLLDHV